MIRCRRAAVAVVSVSFLLAACTSTAPGSARAATTLPAIALAVPEAGQNQGFYPTADNPDPSRDIDGVYIGGADEYLVKMHVTAPQRVAYDRYPPIGGPHDATWAACEGVVYPTAVRNENMVHALEHGAVWIAYNPDTIDPNELEELSSFVDGQSHLVLSPYPGLASTLSLQSWGHQLALASIVDERFLQFLEALRQNQYVTPEFGATCERPDFDIDNPPPFDTSSPGAGSMMMDGTTQ